MSSASGRASAPVVRAAYLHHCTLLIAAARHPSRDHHATSSSHSRLRYITTGGQVPKIIQFFDSEGPAGV